MKNLKDFRELILKKYIIENLIERGISPTNEEVCSILMTDFDGAPVNRSLLGNNHMIQFGELGSKSKLNEIFNFIDIDLETLYQFSEYLIDTVDTDASPALKKLKALEFAIQKLQRETDGLLLINNFSEDQMQLKDIDLTSSQMINNENTTAYIDYDQGEISSSPISSSEIFSLSAIADEIRAVPLTQGYISAYGTAISRLFDNTPIPYVYSMKMPGSFSGYIDVSLKIPLKYSIRLNHIEMNFSSKSSYDLSLSARVDGIFNNIIDPTRYSGNAVMDFEDIETDFLVINIRSYEKYNESLYKISINELKLHRIEYAEKSVFETTAIETTPFSNIALYSAENIPDDCSISHMVSWYSNDEWSSFAEILPFNNSEIDLTKTLSVFSNLNKIESTHAIDFTKLHPYIADLNYGTSISVENVSEVSEIIVSNPKLLRNLGAVLYNNTDPNKASLVFYSTGELEVDFTDYPGVLDGIFVQKQITLSSGFHSFTFNPTSDLSSYITYFDSISGSGLYFGSHASRYTDAESFATMNNDEAIYFFSYVKTGENFTAIVRGNDDLIVGENTGLNEEILLVKDDVTATSLPDKIKLRSELTSNKTHTPVIKNLHIKLG